MASKTSLRPYKLVATNGPMSRDDLSTWEYNHLSFSRQKETWQEFLPGGTHTTWIAEDDDETHGITVYKADLETVDPDKTNKKRSAFKDFLSALAIHCPTNYAATIKREATSWKWVIDYLKNGYNLNTKGEQFLAGNDIKFVFDDTFSYQQGYMVLRDYYISSLAEKDTMFKGKRIEAKEKLSPLSELFIVERWLAKIDPRLPAHVQRTRGQLFSETKPTLACNQRIICDQIDHMLNELDGQSSVGNVTSANTTANVNVGYVPSNRAGFSGGRYPFQRGMRGFRGQGRQSGPRPVRPAPSHCLHCLEAKRYDASITHPSSRCHWVTQRPQQRQQLRQPAPGFKVLLIPNPASPAPEPEQNQQAAYVQNMSMEAQSQVYGDQFHYPEDAGYEYQYQYPAHDDYSGSAAMAEYPPGTLEEL